MSLNISELLSLLVSHHAKLNELHVNGNFGSKKFKRHQNSVRQIQKVIKNITGQPSQSAE